MKHIRHTESKTCSCTRGPTYLWYRVTWGDFRPIVFGKVSLFPLTVLGAIFFPDSSLRSQTTCKPSSWIHLASLNLVRPNCKVSSGLFTLSFFLWKTFLEISVLSLQALSQAQSLVCSCHQIVTPFYLLLLTPSCSNSLSATWPPPSLCSCLGRGAEGTWMAGRSLHTAGLKSPIGMGSVGRDPAKLFWVGHGERANGFNNTHYASQLKSFS